MAREEGLVQELVHLEDRLVDDGDILNLLTALADQALELGAADAAGMGEAFARLRSYARSHQVRMTDVARQVTTGLLLPDELANRTRHAVVAT